MADKPVIIAGSLSDKELQDSIDKLVKAVETGTTKMAQSFDTAVENMKKKLGELGNTRVDLSKVFGDTGGTQRAVSGQEKLAKSVNETTMTYDQMAQATQRAIDANNGYKASFSHSELQQYTQLLRALQAEYIKVNTTEGGGQKADNLKNNIAALEEIIVKYKEILKNVELVNSRQGTIDIRKWTQDLGAVDDRYKQLSRWYTILEQQDQRRIATEEKAEQKRLAAQEKMIQSAKKAEEAYQNAQLKVAFNRAFRMPTDDVDQMTAKLERLKTILANTREIGILSPTQVARAEAEIDKLNGKIQQKATAETSATQSAARYTEEIRKQAQLIRDSQQWKEKGFAIIGGNVVNDPSRSKNVQISLEEQLLHIQEKEAQVQQQVTQSTQATAQAQQQVTQAATGTYKIYGDIHEQARRSREIMSSETQVGGKKTSLFQSYDDLRASVAAVIGVQQEKVKIADVETASNEKLSQSIKQLKQAYDKIGTADKSSDQGKALLQEIQQLERALQKARAQASRPINLQSVLGLDEKTIDDIAYKMRQLSLYRGGLDTNKQSNEIKQVNAEYARLQQRMNEVMQKNNKMIASNNALTRSWNYMKNRLAFYFTVGASTQFVKNLIEVRSQYEMNERALGILVNSAERGTQIFNELSQMSLVSPYTLIELSSAAKQLTAYDIAAKDVVDTTRRLADMASAVGVPIERLTYALGQIKAYGYLNSRDARMFANAGIPLVKELADYYTQLEGKLVSVGDIYDRIKKKAIDFNDVVVVINSMTDEGGKFFDFQEKMAGTLKVQLANLTLAWNNMLNDIGESSQGLITGSIGAIKELLLAWKTIDRVIMDVVLVFGTAKAAQMLLNVIVGKGTLALMKENAAIKDATAAHYSNIVSSNKMTASRASLLIALNRNNAALRSAIVNAKLLSLSEAKAIASAKGLTQAWNVLKFSFVSATKAIGAALAPLLANPMTWILVGITAIVDAISFYNRQADEMAEMNKKIADNAKEAEKSMDDFLKDYINIGNRTKAINGELAPDNAAKVWESLREQIELTSDASSIFIAQLLQEEDINKRIERGFDIAEGIRDAASALSGLIKELEVSQDSWLWGAFGEGLAEDIEDYVEYIQEHLRDSIERGYVAVDPSNMAKSSEEYAEAVREMTKLSNDIENILRDRLGSEGVKDPIKVREAIERIKKEIKAANPQIKGEVERWFDVKLDELLAGKNGFNIDQFASLRKMLIERVRRDSGAILKNLDDDILDASKQIDGNIVVAFHSAFEKLEKMLPHDMHDLLGELQKQLNENPMQFRYAIAEAGEIKQLDEIQKDLVNKFIKEGIGDAPVAPARPAGFGNMGDYFKDFGEYKKELIKYNAEKSKLQGTYGEYFKKDDEDRVKWAERLNKEIKAQEKLETAALKTKEDVSKELGTQLSEEELLKDVRYRNAVADANAARNRIDAAKEVYEYSHLYEEEKKKGGSQKDALLDTLKKEIDIVNQLQSEYDKLTKSGANQAEALETVYGAFGATINLLNKDLANFGLPQLDIEQLIIGKDPHEQLEFFQKTLDDLVGKGLGNLERVKALEAVIQKLTLSAKTYDLDKITKGLNSELSKIKDEYELAIELDANPELGGMFASMFGIDTDKLPQTFGEAFDRANKVAKEKLSKLGADIKDFDLMSSIIEADENGMWRGLDFNSDAVKAIISGQNTYRDMFKNNLTETEKMLDDYVKKYGGYADKIAEIEAGRLEKIKKLNDAYYTEQMRKMPEYIAKLNAIEQGATQEKQQAGFDEFKNSRYYTMMFENLDYISTKTIMDMRDRLRELMDTMHQLTPEQLKQVMSQYEKLEQKLVKRRPFKTLAKDFKDYINQTKARNAANDELRTVQQQYDAEQMKLASLKEQYEQAKASRDTKKEDLITLTEELATQEKILQTLKEQVDEASKKADKYNLVKKLALEEFTALANMIAANLQSLGEFRDFLQEDLNIDLGVELNGFIDGLSKAGTGISKITSSAQNGDLFGVLTGAGQVVTGIIDGVASIFGDGSARTKKINKQIEKSVENVRKLNMAYKKLQSTIDTALGAEEIAARREAISNKEQQLAETKKQLNLEKSKRSKDRDDNAIKQYEEAIQDLELEIKELRDEVVNTLLGTDVKSAAEEFIDTWVEAWKAGETTLDAIQEKMDGMIETLIKKTLTNKIVGNLLQPLYDEIDKMTSAGSDGGTELTIDELKQIAQHAGKYTEDINTALGEFYGNLEKLGIMSKTIGDDEKNLSALSAGIQSITEETANAVEAYLNSMSQQVYLQSDVLTEIRDTIQGFDMDIQIASMSQILLQLQASYSVQMSIQGILEGWSNASGQAVKVELIS